MLIFTGKPIKTVIALILSLLIITTAGLLAVKRYQHSHPPIQWQVIHVQKNDSLAKIFKRNHLNYQQLKQLLKNPIARQHLLKLHPGDTLFVDISPQHQLRHLRYPINSDQTLLMKNTKQHPLTVSIEKKTITSKVIYKTATITHSLQQAAQHAGINQHLIAQLSSIFQGDINFSRDVQPGDHFSLLYKAYYINGKLDHTSNILAATFTNRNKTHTAIHFTYPSNHHGYYTPTGRGMEPLFLKAPVKYQRISSFFTYHRMDPYLHKMRPHLGIDYAAPWGTPIHTVGSGTVIFCRKDGGYGNAILIRYNKTYKILYGHMSRFAKGLHRHQYVHRGQVIGYIGSTGWSTGPHLHFEVYVNGTPRNPLTIKFPNNPPIPSSYHAAFMHHAQTLLAELNLHQDTELADASNITEHDS